MLRTEGPKTFLIPEMNSSLFPSILLRRFLCTFAPPPPPPFPSPPPARPAHHRSYRQSRRIKLKFDFSVRKRTARDRRNFSTKLSATKSPIARADGSAVNNRWRGVTTAARMPAFSIQGWCQERSKSTSPWEKNSYKRIAAICQSSRSGARIGTTRFNFLFHRFLLAGLTSLERRESRYVCHKEIATELLETRLFFLFFFFWK